MFGHFLIKIEKYIKEGMSERRYIFCELNLDWEKDLHWPNLAPTIKALI